MGKYVEFDVLFAKSESYIAQGTFANFRHRHQNFWGRVQIIHLLNRIDRESEGARHSSLYVI